MIKRTVKQMSRQTPIERANVLLEKTTPLTNEDKKLFAYFGVDAKILPPLRILNPQLISIGDITAIREGCHINAFTDLSFLMDYIDAKYRGDFKSAHYRYNRGSKSAAKTRLDGSPSCRAHDRSRSRTTSCFRSAFSSATTITVSAPRRPDHAAAE